MKCTKGPRKTSLSRKKRSSLLTLAWLLLLSTPVLGQLGVRATAIPDVRPPFHRPFYPLLSDGESLTDFTAPDLRTSMLQPRLTPQAYRMAEPAFFCRIEARMEKTAGLPVRFRLGDVQYVDYLEGKIDGWRWGW